MLGGLFILRLKQSTLKKKLQGPIDELLEAKMFCLNVSCNVPRLTAKR